MRVGPGSLRELPEATWEGGQAGLGSGRRRFGNPRTLKSGQCVSGAKNDKIRPGVRSGWKA